MSSRRRIRGKPATAEDIEKAVKIFQTILSGGAKESYEVMREAIACGIKIQAIGEAKQILGIKKHRGKLYMAIHEIGAELSINSRSIAGSCEWVRVICEDEGGVIS